MRTWAPMRNWRWEVRIRIAEFASQNSHKDRIIHEQNLLFFTVKISTAKKCRHNGKIANSEGCTIHLSLLITTLACLKWDFAHLLCSLIHTCSSRVSWNQYHFKVIEQFWWSFTLLYHKVPAPKKTGYQIPAVTQKWPKKTVSHQNFVFFFVFLDSS